MIKLPKKTINVLLILATLVAAVYYFSKHRSLLSQLKHTPPLLLIAVFLLYVVMFMVLVLILSATLGLTRIKLDSKENALLNAYTLAINFFIPGQAGPAYRGYYLYKKHKLKILDYTLATIIYYLAYGIISLILVFAGSRSWWLTLVVSIMFVAVGAIGAKLYLAKYKHERLNLRLKPLGYLALATLSQTMVQMLIYFTELHHLNHAIKLDQVVTYTGVANLALFVGLTPGAIGIRESFLLLTEKLNHISSSNIVLANVIDRSVYIVFLLTLIAIVFAFKAKDRLGLTKPTSSQQNTS